MQKMLFIIVVYSILCSCVFHRNIKNERDSTVDVNEVITITDSMFRVKEFYDIYEKKYIPITREVLMHHGLGLGDRDKLYFKYSLSYCLGFHGNVLPTIKLNSFSFTDKKGIIIPSTLYHITDTNGKSIYSTYQYLYDTNNMVRNIIDSFPAIFTQDTNTPLVIFAECSQSYRKTKLIYVNYDIEVGDKRYIKHIKYKRKWHFWCFLMGRP